MEAFHSRIGFLDFETIQRAVPVWPGIGPWEQTPAQFSYHEVQDDGTYAHDEFLAEGPKDCRPALVHHMLEATRRADTIATYSHFERTKIQALQKAVPELKPELEALEHKLVDLLRIVREHVYHPDFLGSFSLKYVLTPLQDLKVNWKNVPRPFRLGSRTNSGVRQSHARTDLHQPHRLGLGDIGPRSERGPDPRGAPGARHVELRRPRDAR